VLRSSCSSRALRLAVFALAGAAAAAAAVAQDVPLRNWSAPRSWVPAVGSGTRRLMGDLSNAVPFIPITPCRLADTRGLGFTGQAGPPHLTANMARDFEVAGTVTGIPTPCGIPAGAYAASLNFTVVNVTSNGNLIAWPTGATQPNTSVLNWSAGAAVVGNSGVVPIAAGGTIRVLANAPAGATVDLIVDVNGYYAAFLNNNEGLGVSGSTASQAVIYGHNSGANGYGVWGDVATGFGVYGTSAGDAGSGGVLGSCNVGAGVTGTSSIGLGVYGLSDDNAGVWAFSTNSTALVAVGGADGTLSEGGTGNGVTGTHASGIPNGAYSTDQAGVMGATVMHTGVIGVAQLNNPGIAGSFHKLNDASPYGDTTHVTLCPSGAVAGNFFGNVNINPAASPGTGNGNLSVNGTLSKGGGSFKIDHPLDPQNKYLYHSFVESPDMKNVYDGNVVLDAHGEALVELPDWFEALNSDFRYQLTSIGRFSPVYVAEEIAGNQFRIAGGRPGGKVSWQVTGIRQDAFAKAHRIPVEVEKVGEEKGRYLHPAEHGVSAEKALWPVLEREEREKAEAARH
jgi:hypothetical protein